MLVLDATVVTIALPSAQMDLGFSNADRQWVVTAYSLSFGGPSSSGADCRTPAFRTLRRAPGDSQNTGAGH